MPTLSSIWRLSQPAGQGESGQHFSALSARRPPVIHVFFDTEFSSLLDPRVWSIGLVTLAGRECYAELDPESDVGRERLAATPWDVRESILDKFGRFPDSMVDSDWSLGRRAGEWLLEAASSDADGRVELLYDYSTDLELLVGVLEECNLWPQVRVAASEINVAGRTGTIGPDLASEATFRELRSRAPPLYRHHALADALALRAAWRMWHLRHERALDFNRLLQVVGIQQECWLYEWLSSPAHALGHQIPLDVLDQPDGVQLVVEALVRIEHGVY
jgi:hypothetical protein